jgi:hypothetical protein
MAVLIEVPKVQPPRVRQREMTASREAWRPVSPRRNRPRRLRRGVRLAAWSLMALMPTLGGGALGWANLATRAAGPPAWNASGLIRGEDREVEPTTASIDVRSVFLESNEPVVGAPVSDLEVPVMIPGYLLPDDSLEEPAHEGS